MAANQNVKQSAFGAKSRREFTLPPFPQPPEVIQRRFPEWREYAAQTEQWRQTAQQLIADAILALSESTTP